MCHGYRAIHLPTRTTVGCLLRQRPNFVGTDKEFLLCVENWNKKAPSLLAHRKNKRKFNPASAPHHGGSWERMVRSCKQVLYVILGSRRLTDEVLQTSLCLTEQFLNARPLTSVSNDPTEIEALTPNYFLLRGPCSSFPSLDSCDINHRKRYASGTHAHKRTLIQFGLVGSAIILRA